MEPDVITALRTDLADDPLPPPVEALGWRDLAKHSMVRGLAVLAVLALVSAFMLWRAGTPHAAVAAAVPSAAPIIALPTASRTPALVVVDVAGKVRRPGLVRLPSGSRVADAVAAAGGAKPGTSLDGLNLARVLVDGEQIAVGQPPASSAGSSATGAGPTAKVSLNNATASDLDALPGIGPVLAQRIVTWREQHGPFRSVDALTDVPGIGPAMLARLADLVVV